MSPRTTSTSVTAETNPAITCLDISQYGKIMEVSRRLPAGPLRAIVEEVAEDLRLTSMADAEMETAPATLTEAQLFREFIKADTIKKYDWRGKLSDITSISYLLVEDVADPKIGEIVNRNIIYALHNDQSNDSLDFLAGEFEYMADQLRFVSRYFEELKAERQVRSDDDAEKSRYRSIADAQSEQDAGEAA